jgi:hypothetical protein
MTVTKLFPSGCWEICDIIDGIFVSRRYFFYTKKEAIAEFKKEMYERKGN